MTPLKRSPEAYVQTEKHLPSELRDFHAQKAIFKRVWRMVTKSREKHPDRTDYLRDMDWMAGHIFVIDFFLWFMALHGWTLQRSRVRDVNFYDLESTVKQEEL